MRVTKKDAIYSICLNPDCKNNNEGQSLRLINLKNSQTKCKHCEWDLGWTSSKGDVYFLETAVDEGGFGSIYRAWKKEQDGFEGEYALKLFYPDPEYNPDSIKREVENLGKAYEAGARVPECIDYHYPQSTIKSGQKSYIFVVQEYLEGDSLKKILETREREKTQTGDKFYFYFEEKEVFEYLVDLLETLYLIHEKIRLLHRDIKPANIIFRENSAEEEQKKNYI